MGKVKLSIIYYSATGTVHSMAQHLARKGEEAGAEVRIRQVAELAPESAIARNAAWHKHYELTRNDPRATAEDIIWPDAVLLGSPTRYGNISSQLKQYIDTLGPQWSKGLLADKVYAGFTASMTTHGGQETTLLALYTTIYHFGGYIVPPGYTDQLKYADGNPYGVSHVTGGNNDDPLTEVQLSALDHLVRRVIRVAGKLSA
jgi:NAD(P)H dehydrogenase (quinone)